uniref:Ovule protein n=1 Tax=Taenia asiatica TaxID=60517 RepID=A0A0R3VZN3_TAEAS
LHIVCCYVIPNSAKITHICISCFDSSHLGQFNVFFHLEVIIGFKLWLTIIHIGHDYPHLGSAR